MGAPGARAAAPDTPQDSRPLAVDALRLPGAKAYARHCAPCHGERGRGDGVAARFLDPPPRDFGDEPFRLVSTHNGVPSRTDVFETVATGVGGTAMVPFASLGEETVWQLVDVVEAFRVAGLRRRLAEAGLPAADVAAAVERQRPLPLPEEAPETPATFESAARGLIHYRALCASCHGVDGRGLMPDSVPARVKPAIPRNFSRGVFKQIPSSRNLFNRIRCGMPGTAMPATPPATLAAEGAWDLVHYLRTLVPEGAQFLASADSQRITALRLEGDPPASPDDPRFREAPATWVTFAPMRDAAPGPPGAWAQALAGERLVAFRLVVPDPTMDVPSPAAARAPDGIAVRVTATPGPPILPMSGQVPRIDRALFLTGPFGGAGANDAGLPTIDNPEGVCRMVLPPDRAGVGEYRQGSWHFALAVRTEQAGSPLGTAPLSVSFATFDGSLRRGPMPVGFSHWHRLAVR
jgi:mono/diheme cytochrome c family protein